MTIKHLPQLIEMTIEVPIDVIARLMDRSKTSFMTLEQVASLMIRAGLMATDKRKEHEGD